MSASWTIRELCERVEQQLAADAAPANGQVRAVPDERSIRYYTTLGLLDRPTLRGRTALYGPRHLAQVVTIKRWQADGQSLAEIQRQLPTLDDDALQRASGVVLVAAPRPAARRDFWRVEPTAAPTAEAAPASDPPRSIPPLTSLLELTLSPGVRLAFHTTRPATDADATALLDAAAPLLAELVRRHLISPPSPNPITTPERSLEDRR